MIINDASQAEVWLRRVGYYRLSGYWYPFRERKLSGQEPVLPLGEVLDTFRPGTALSHVFDLYVFDKRLRLLFLDALERIEVALRVDIALLLGENDPWAHRNPNTFNPYFRTVDLADSAVRHTKWLAYLDQLAGRSKEEFAKHFAATYKDPLPIWIAIELWDFGTLSALVNGMKDRHLQVLADKYRIPRRTMLVSWVQCLNFVRNICAHHGRLWNRPLVIQPALFRRDESPAMQHMLVESQTRTRCYAAAAIIQFLLTVMSPTSAWGERLRECMDGLPPIPGIDASSAGFPFNWTQEKLWRREEETKTHQATNI